MLSLQKTVLMAKRCLQTVNIGQRAKNLLHLKRLRSSQAQSASGWTKRLETRPLATLSVSGQCCALTVKTNLETYFADISADIDGTACDPTSVATVSVADDGHISVGATNPRASISIGVPAAFNVLAAMGGGTCFISLRGWLEGGVDLSTEIGNVEVGTIKGMLAR